MPYLRFKTLTEEDYKTIGINFYKSAKNHGMTVQTCAEKRNLKEYGFKVFDCVTKEIAKKFTGKENFKTWQARKGKCNCVSMVDIGEYNTCLNLCKYCYANYDEIKVKDNVKLHNVESSLLIGNINDQDEIIARKR